MTLTFALHAQSPAGGPSPATNTLVTVPALTPVIVRVEAQLSSKTSKIGDRFDITVAEDVRVGDTVVIPAGARGQGEVIHAAKHGMGGKAGELIVAARFVRVGDVEVRLRSFTLGAAGKDMSVDSLAASLMFGPFGLIQKGGEALILPNMLGTAKTASELNLPAVVRPASQPEAPQQITEETTEGEVDVPKTD
jgi:hypothetical protein